jgi:ABC-2 type transport system ATP-binding protein
VLVCQGCQAVDGQDLRQLAGRAIGRVEQIERNSGATLLLASHNMGEVERLADRVLMMRAGKLVDDNTPAGLIAHYGRTTLEEVFLDIARAGRTEPA